MPLALSIRTGTGGKRRASSQVLLRAPMSVNRFLYGRPIMLYAIPDPDRDFATACCARLPPYSTHCLFLSPDTTPAR